MTSIAPNAPGTGQDPAPHLAWRSAETIRSLVHLTGQAGFTEPADVYEMVAALTATSYALPQLLGQAARWLQAQHVAGTIRADGAGLDGDAGRITAAAVRQLTDAGRAATRLADLLDTAGQQLAGLAAGHRP